MAGSLGDLPPGGTVDKVVYSQTVEGLFVRALDHKLSATCKAELKAVGIDLDAPLRSTYPAEAWGQGLQVVRRHLYPASPEEKGMRQLGRVFIDGFHQTLPGKVIVSVARLTGPSRSVGPLSRRLATGNNYMRAETRALTETSLHIWLNDAGPGGPWFMLGIFERSLEIVGARKVELDAEPHPDNSVDFRGTWL